MSSEYEEVRAVLFSLTKKLKNCEEIFTSKDIGYCLVGIQNMQPNFINYNEVNEFLEELNLKVSSSECGGQLELLFLQYGKAVRLKR
jgi:hypothetical protein